MLKKNTNNFKQLANLLAALPIMVAALTANAAHDDTTLRTLQVSVANVAGVNVTIDISGSGHDSEDLASAYLGTQALGDSSVGTWNPSAPPAINWGDGSTLAATQIPFTDTVTASPLDRRTFTGQFMHTYAAPGNYTISVFGSNIYAASASSYSIASGTFSAVSPSFNDDTVGSGSQPIGILQRISVAVGATPATPVPLLPNLALLALGALLILFGAAALRRV
jgi:hypothetical protein